MERELTLGIEIACAPLTTVLMFGIITILLPTSVVISLCTLQRHHITIFLGVLRIFLL